MYSPTFFSSLPHELLLEIFKKLPTKTIFKLGRVNKHLEKVSRQYLFNSEWTLDKNKKIAFYTPVLSTNQFKLPVHWEPLNVKLYWFFYQSPYTLFKNEKYAQACFEVKLSYQEMMHYLKDMRIFNHKNNLEKNYILSVRLPKESIQAAYIPEYSSTELIYQKNPYALQDFSFK